jgi:hypothetical protein
MTCTPIWEASAGVIFPSFFAIESDVSLISRINAGNCFYQGRFSAAILTAEAHDSARLDIKVYVVKSMDAAECFADPPHFK